MKRAHSKYTYVKAQNITTNRVLLCLGFDVKPFYTHWYCQAEDLIASYSYYFDIPNDYNIEET